MEAGKYLGILLMMVQLKCNNRSSLQYYSMNLQMNYRKQRRKKVTAPTSRQSLINVKSTTSASISKHNDRPIILANNDSENRNNNILLKKKYFQLLGTLMYATKSRPPEIKFATSLAATKSSNPTDDDYQQLVHIMKYL
jgi:hypothetical protein